MSSGRESSSSCAAWLMSPSMCGGMGGVPGLEGELGVTYEGIHEHSEGGLDGYLREDHGPAREAYGASSIQHVKGGTGLDEEGNVHKHEHIRPLVTVREAVVVR